MNKIYESKLMKGLQRFGEKFATNKAFSAISKSMMGLIGIILVGALFQIVATIPTLFGWLTTESTFYKFCMAPYNATFGIISVYVVFLIAYNYSKSLKMKPIQDGVTALALFLLVAAPVQNALLSDGVTSINYLDTSSLGGVGLFVAILIGLLSVKITNLCHKLNIVVKMPDAVPQFLQDSFSAMIPLAINLLIWHGLNTVISGALSVTLPMAINAVLSFPLMALNSVPGMIVIILFACLLWTFGIHGTMVAFIALMPVLMQDISANAAAVAAGQDPQFYASFLLFTIACAGGTGNSLGLVLMGLKSKSEQIKSVSKVALVPAFFNINEPATFGYPIMYNPILAIPFILTPVITCLLVWLGYAIGFFKPAYIMMMSLMPLGVVEFLSTMAWQNLLIPVVGFVVGLIIYFPFFKAYEKQLIAKEALQDENTVAA